jgi:hypothetical protein
LQQDDAEPEEHERHQAQQLCQLAGHGVILEVQKAHRDGVCHKRI